MIRSKVNGVYVYGYYAKVGKKDCLVPEKDAQFHCYADEFRIGGVYVIDRSQTAVATGEKVNGVEIFGSMEVDGVMFADGDRVAFSTFNHNGIDTQHEALVVFDYGEWVVRINNDDERISLYSLCEHEPELEIIPKEEFTPTPYTHIRHDKSGELWKMQHVPGCEWFAGECDCGANAINAQIEVLDKQEEKC